MTEVLLKVGVKAVTGTQLELSDGSSIPYGLAVWAAGNGPLPLVLDLIQAVDEQKEKASWGRCYSCCDVHYICSLCCFGFVDPHVGIKIPGIPIRNCCRVRVVNDLHDENNQENHRIFRANAHSYTCS